ncbi:hypothetical protein BN2475_70012 [Paraburkholderia ribeironis]|uniref:Uncharacterized protein n=1 Tax=Paraburkholderia ribeironis TaxID=1247936 RepID=A0A1N7RMM9_9BURK|nr:hypothetical protein BN2475_70012 [Paraburkholderia ribeironis]
MGINYAASFLLMHFLHFSLATRQPAMTAPTHAPTRALAHAPTHALDRAPADAPAGPAVMPSPPSARKAPHLDRVQ